MKSIKEINYSPTSLARSLHQKHYRFVCLIPAYQPGEYWESIETGFDRAAGNICSTNVHLEKVYFNQYDPQFIQKGIAQILLIRPDAVILAPVFPMKHSIFKSSKSWNSIFFYRLDARKCGFYHLLWSKFLSKRISGCEIIAEFFCPENSKNTDNYYQQKNAETHQTKFVMPDLYNI